MEETPVDREEDGHFVYLYRDLKGNVLYVGYGSSHQRVTIHSSRSHRKTLGGFLKKNKFSLEFVGPFRSELTGRAVETALISALHPRFNEHLGATECRLRPFGLPTRFADRLLLPALNRADCFRQVGSAAAAVLFVYIGNKDFYDGRVPYNPTRPPRDEQILNRMDRGWQIGRHVELWHNNPSQSPIVLVGLTGRPKDRFIIGAIKIDQDKWASVKKKRGSGLYPIPTTAPINLDAFKLRGRRVSPDANLKFGAFSSQFFIILQRNGRVLGGASN